ncbi:MAG: hypothetical protein OK455_06325 [Thaumarchaeota archaeon]|nr:hypothetical protein [Nitrososphaerota archaeon]
MEKQHGEGMEGMGSSASLENESGKPVGALLIPAAMPSFSSVKVLTVSNLLKLVLPPLFVASLPKRAIGFSFPRGREGAILGLAVLGATITTSFLATMAFGVLAGAAAVWLFGGTAVVMLYNSVSGGLTFVKHRCSTCRLRPIIEEHELMHLNGEPSEEAVWRAAKKKYSYDGLGLGTDPKICSFCPIAKRLKANP